MATNRYVSKTGSNTSPYDTWEKASTVIQSVLNIAFADDTIWIRAGTYYENITVRKWINVRSETGIPTDVIIDGGLANRVVTMEDQSSWLIGITVANGRPPTTDSMYGVGVLSGTISNCIITGNSPKTTGNVYGGGVSGSMLYNCLLVGNTAHEGGGANSSTLYNCTLVKNTATRGGGAYSSGLYNCISYLNNQNDYAGSNSYSCGPTYAGTGSINSNVSPPLFVGSTNYHLQDESPCIDAGLNYSWMTDPSDPRSKDLDGNPRIHNTIVDMGAYESATVDFSSSSYSSSSTLSSSSFSLSTLSSLSSSSISSSSISSISSSSVSSSSLSSISSFSTEHHLDPPYNLTFIADPLTRKITIGWLWDNPSHLVTEPTGFTIDRKIGLNSWEILSYSIPPEDRLYEDVLSEENAALVFAYGNQLSYRIRAFLVA